MNTLHLKYAVEIEKTGSISKAAENLYMGQPALSRTIKELENSLGITIFQRTSAGVIPTQKGSLFLQYAKNILSQLSEMESLYKSDVKTMQRLSISVPRSTYIAKAFKDFVKELDHEQIMNLRYKETNSMRTMNKLSVGEYNLGIIRYKDIYEEYFLKSFSEKKFEHRRLWEFDRVAIMSKNHPLANKVNVTYEELRNYTELLHGDNMIPYLAVENTNILSTQENLKKKIYIFERGSQFELLSEINDTYMMTAPIPQGVLDKYSLVEKKCVDASHYKDVLIYRNSYAPTRTDRLLLDKIKLVIRDLETKNNQVQ